MTTEAQLSSILKNKQKSFKPDLFETKVYLILSTRKYLKSSEVMLLYNLKIHCFLNYTDWFWPKISMSQGLAVLSKFLVQICTFKCWFSLFGLQTSPATVTTTITTTQILSSRSSCPGCAGCVGCTGCAMRELKNFVMKLKVLIS